jgi:hypothetical protein
MIKRRSTATSMIQDTRAQSEVLGALIILAILLSASSIYLARHVPKWTAECEARHASEVPQDFAQLTADIDRAILSGDPVSTTSTPIGMIPEVVPLVGIYASGGTLRFNQSKETFECIASAPDEPVVPSGNDTWNKTADWVRFNDTYHVLVTASKAELEPAARGNLTIRQNTSLSGEYYYNHFSVENNATLTIDGRLSIHALKIFIEEGSSITADDKGWSGGLGNAPGSNGNGVGGGLGGNQSQTGNEGGDGGGGGGCGGNGGDGGDNPASGGDASDLMVYLVPSCVGEIMGSGGGGGGDGHDSEGQMIASSGGDGGSGGGYVCLDATVLDIRGNISACGSPGEGKLQYGNETYRGGGGGGGSGGWIKLIGDNVNITGFLIATGGDGGGSAEGDGGGGGGGGIVEAYYHSEISPAEEQIKENQMGVLAGKGGDVSGINDTRKGNNGAPGIKNVTAIALHSSPLFHYETGYLVSNLTAIQGHLGYDTNSTYICYGNLTYGANLPVGTDIVLKVRTSMYSDMHDAVPWEECPAVANGTDISDLFSVSDGHRYIQWRAELLTFAPERTPVLYWVNITYGYGEPVLVHTSGKLEFDSQYLYYPNYQLIYAQGATVRAQPEGSFMLFEPPIFIQSTASGTQLSMTAFELAGSEQTISGRVSATVQASCEDATLLKRDLNYANVTLKLTTDYPSIWKSWFNTTCRDAGLPYGTDPGEYMTNQTGDTLQITFYGNESYPVNVWLKRATVRLELSQ